VTIVILTTLIAVPVAGIMTYHLRVMALRGVMEIEPNGGCPPQIVAPAARRLATRHPRVAFEVNIFPTGVVVIDFVARVVNIAVLSDHMSRL
jgi:hypothetical protein